MRQSRGGQSNRVSSVAPALNATGKGRSWCSVQVERFCRGFRLTYKSGKVDYKPNSPLTMLVPALRSGDRVVFKLAALVDASGSDLHRAQVVDKSHRSIILKIGAEECASPRISAMSSLRLGHRTVHLASLRMTKSKLSIGSGAQRQAYRCLIVLPSEAAADDGSRWMYFLARNHWNVIISFETAARQAAK